MYIVARVRLRVRISVSIIVGGSVKATDRIRARVREQQKIVLGNRQTRTFTLAFVRVHDEPSVAFLAHGRALLGAPGADHWHTVVTCAYVGWDTHA